MTLREALGSEVLVHFTIDARPAMTDEMRELAEDVGDDRGVGQLAAGERRSDGRRSSGGSALVPTRSKATSSRSRSILVRCTSSIPRPVS